jgi:penicillin-binding protein 2
LTDAIKVSCDSFFYQFGNAAGIDAIDQTGNALGLGKETGIHLTGEQPGIMPGPEWMAIHYPRERWSQAYTANVSIGQGYVLASPLQDGDGLRYRGERRGVSTIHVSLVRF